MVAPLGRVGVGAGGASDAKKRDVLVPAFIERVDPPFGFKLRHAVDLTSWQGAAGAPEFSGLAAAVAALVPPDPSTVQVPPPGSAERRGWRIAPAALILVAVAVVGGAAGLSVWDAYHRIQTEYFANVTKRYGLPSRASDASMPRLSPGGMSAWRSFVTAGATR